MREAYSHEVSSAGFWPGGSGIDYAAFYSYSYPVPEGFGRFAIKPEAAFFHEGLGEFLLPYDGRRSGFLVGCGHRDYRGGERTGEPVLGGTRLSPAVLQHLN